MPSVRLKNKKHVIPLTLLQFSDFGTHLLIEAEVNRVKNCYFVVDTGASSSVVDSNIKSLKIIKPDNDISSFALSEGSMETAFCIIKKFKAGDVVFKDYYMACMDLSALQKMYKKVSKDKVIGLLGGDFLSINKAVIDYKNCIMTVEPEYNMPSAIVRSLFD